MKIIPQIVLSNSVGAWCFVSVRTHRIPTVGFLLLQHFSYFLLSSPRRCFILLFVWFLSFRRCCTDELETLHADGTNILVYTTNIIKYIGDPQVRPQTWDIPFQILDNMFRTYINEVVRDTSMATVSFKLYHKNVIFSLRKHCKEEFYISIKPVGSVS